MPDQTPAQCGRTFVHLPHPTTNGECAGLDANTVPDGRRQRAIQDARDAVAQRPLASA